MNPNSDSAGNNSNPFSNGAEEILSSPTVLLGGELSNESAKRPSIVERVASGVGVGIRKASGVFGSNSLNLNISQAASPSGIGSAGGASDQNQAPEATISMKPEDYELKQVIGQGSSAIVYLAVYKVTGKLVSIKVIDLDMFERNQIDELRRELQIMTLSKHPNLLPVYGSFVNGSKLFIVTPFLSAGSGLDIMKTAFQKGMDEAVIATILKQVLQGLEYLHSHGLIHRDIKAGNLLVGSDGLVQLADFGVSSSLTDHGSRGASRKTFVGTPCWMAPEVMDQSGYDYKADIWSFGITALELANGHAPYAKFPPMKVLMLTLQNPPPSLDRDATFYKYSKAFKDMIDACLQKDPAKRPSAEKLLTHPFFKVSKKPAYLVSTLLNGLTPITERTHLQKHHDDTIRSAASDQNEEWDFETASSAEDRNSPLDCLEKERVGGVHFNVDQSHNAVSNATNPSPPKSRVSFHPTPDTILAENTPSAALTAEPLDSDTLQRSSALSFSNTTVNNDIGERGSTSTSENRYLTPTTFDNIRSSSIVSATSSNDASISSSNMPRKSRFTIDTPASATRADSMLSTASSVNNDPGTLGVPLQGGSSTQPSPLLAEVAAGGTQVQKGRFSVIDSKTAAAGGVGSGSGTTSFTTSVLPPIMALSPSTIPSSSPVQSFETGEGSSSQVAIDTGVNTSERKAGRFAFQNLPTSAVTSPVLGASDGPKIPRNRFTIVSETTGGAGTSVNTSTGTAANVTLTRNVGIEKGEVVGVEGEKKTSRFRVIVESEFPQVEALLNHAESLLSTHIPGISLGLGVTSSSTILNESGVSGGSEGETAFQVPALVKMVETQRAVIADLISLVKNMPVRSLSCESGLGGGTDQEN